MGAYEDIHCLEDFGIIAGSYKILYIDCIDSNGKPIDLSVVTRYGCNFFYLGTDILAFNIPGEIMTNDPSCMIININSSFTEDFGTCCLEYVPYLYTGGNIIKFGKGRLTIEEG